MSVLDQLKSLESAEAFFQFLEVPYDPQVLGVARLHILKRMGQGLAQRDFSQIDDAEVRAAARAILTSAYKEFSEGVPLNRRLFKVLKDHDPARPAKARGKSYFALGDLR